ncbi:MAG: Holliday junction resolvase RuvX [Rhodobacteraceae bacterium]|nr:Holliday junction resolvase RuvX [Paracoccaceae bacterium]
MSRVYSDVEDYLAELPELTALMGLDLGDKTIGIAISDAFRTIATPRETIRRKKFGLDATRLEQLIDENNIHGLVLGMPHNMDGSEGPRCQSTRAFARNFTARRDIPILLWDERLSTVAAERALLEADTSRRKRALVIDHVAASYILQGALDRMAHIRNG